MENFSSAAAASNLDLTSSILDLLKQPENDQFNPKDLHISGQHLLGVDDMSAFLDGVFRKK